MDDWVRKSGLLIVAPLVAYLTGFMYLNEFYKLFGIDLASLNIPLQHYFVQAFGALYASVLNGEFVGCAMLTGLATFCALALAPVPKLRFFFAIAAVVVAALTLLSGFQLGYNQALIDAAAISHGAGARIRFFTTPEFTGPLQDERFVEANDGGALRLVWEDHDRWIVIVSNPAAGQIARGRLLGKEWPYTYEIPMRLVVASMRRNDIAVLRRMK